MLRIAVQNCYASKSHIVVLGSFNNFFPLKCETKFRPELSPIYFSNFGPNPARTRTRPEKPGPTYNSADGDSLGDAAVVFIIKQGCFSFSDMLRVKVFIYSTAL